MQFQNIIYFSVAVCSILLLSIQGVMCNEDEDVDLFISKRLAGKKEKMKHELVNKLMPSTKDDIPSHSPHMGLPAIPSFTKDINGDTPAPPIKEEIPNHEQTSRSSSLRGSNNHRFGMRSKKTEKIPKRQSIQNSITARTPFMKTSVSFIPKSQEVVSTKMPNVRDRNQTDKEGKKVVVYKSSSDDAKESYDKSLLPMRLETI